MALNAFTPDQVFPVLPGLGWSVKRTPVWQTRRQTSVSGKETTQADWSYPRWKWTLTFEALDQASGQFARLVGFINGCAGGAVTFLYQDDTDNVATAQVLGNGDGATTRFQLIRAFGGFIEPVTAPGAISAVRVGGVATSAYSVDAATGILTFAAAPAASAAITADFSYFWRCRFSNDENEFEEIMAKLWTVQTLEFGSVK